MYIRISSSPSIYQNIYTTLPSRHKRRPRGGHLTKSRRGDETVAIYMYLCIYVYMHMFYVSMYIYICMYIYIYIYIYISMYT